MIIPLNNRHAGSGTPPQNSAQQHMTPLQFANALLQQAEGKGKLNPRGLAQAIQQLADAEPEFAAQVRAEIAKQLSPVELGRLDRDMRP